MELKQKSFQEIHNEAAKEFGVIWIKVNRVITETAQKHNINISKPSSKLALTDIALAFLRNFKVEDKNE
jgi:hypothetical protein